MSEPMMRAAITTGDPSRPVQLGELPRPVPGTSQALIRVAATSLNAGEVRRAGTLPAGRPIGWDLAGTVERAATDGSGPPAGTRVVTFIDAGGWAEYAVAETRQIAVLPDGVTYEDAATLPVAGLTALRTLARGGTLLERRVLVVPGTGGVGLYAIALARLQGAHVSAVIRDPADVALLREIGADDVIVGPTGEARSRPRFDVILESLGGESLADALASVAPEGVVVSFGQTLASQTTFNSAAFYATGGASLYGFYLFHEAARVPVAADLERLAALVRAGRLRTFVDAVYPAAELETAVAGLRERRVTGKIVVRFA